MCNPHRLLKKHTAWLLAFCLLLSLGAPNGRAETAASAPLSVQDGAVDGMVRVYLSSLGSSMQVNLTISGSYSLDGTGGTALAYGSQVTVRMNASNGQLTLISGGVTAAMGTDFRLRRHGGGSDNGVKISQARVSGNVYPGDVQFRSALSGGAYRLYTIVHVFIEDYLYGVLPYEMGNSSALEALKAQCVCARTYTLRAMRANTSRSYDVVDTTNDQVYNGTPSGSARCRQAVDETRGIVAMNGGALTATYYTASNGGQIESTANIWGESGSDYIRVKDDPFDYQNPASAVRSFRVAAGGAQSSATLTGLLNSKARAVFGASNASVTQVQAVIPHTPRYAAPSRLYTKLDFAVTAVCDGVTRQGTLTFDIFSELEKQLGMSINGDNNELWSVVETESGFTVQARRFGHGTGMSQRGAMRMGELGYSYDRILAFYFEGCSRARFTFVRAGLSALTAGASQTELSVDTPAEIGEGPSAVGVVQLGSAAAEMALRVSASPAADIIIGLPQGAAVAVHAVVQDWYLVSYGVLAGYVQGEGLRVSGVMDGRTPAVTTLTAYGMVKGTDYLNLRQGPGMEAEVLGQIPPGTVLPLLTVSGGWAYTQYGCQPGYVNMDFIRTSERYSGPAVDGNATGAQVTAPEGAALYLTAGTSGYQAMTVPFGAVVKVKHDDGSWSQVWYGGVTGYMLSSALQANGMIVDETADTPAPGEQYAAVRSTGAWLNMREEPAMTAAVMVEIPKGETVIVTSAGAEWSQVRYHGAEGYCMSQYLQLGAPSEPQQEEQLLTAVVTTPSGSLNLRKSASAQANILTTIPQNTTIAVQERGTAWCKVTYGGFIGYVMTKFLRFGDAVQPTAAPTAAPVTAAPQPTPPMPTGAQVTTASGSLNLRKEPAADANILARIPQYEIVQVLGVQGAWTQVAYGGRIGYVMSVFLTYLYTPQTEVTPAPTQAAAATPAPTAAPVPVLTAPPAPLEETRQYARVTTVEGSLNLRRKASSTAEILTRIPQNEIIDVEARQGNWTRVSYQGRTGYVMTAFLTFLTVPVAVTPRPTENVSGSVLTAQVTTERGSLNLRERASSGTKVLTTIPQNAWVTVLSRGEKWCQVTYGKYTGYAMTAFLTFSAPQAVVTPAPATAAPIQSAGEPYAQVNTAEGSLNLRSRASSAAKVLRTIPQYAVIAVLDKGTVWTQVEYGGDVGYVKTQFLTFLSAYATETPLPVPGEMAELSQPMAVRVTPAGETVLLRAAPDDNAAAHAVVLRGEYVLLRAQGAAWCRVDYEGMTGYLPTDSLELP